MKILNLKSNIFTIFILPLMVFSLILFLPAAVLADGLDDSTDFHERDSADCFDQVNTMNSHSESRMPEVIEIGEIQSANNPETLNSDYEFSAGESSLDHVNESDTYSSNLDQGEHDSPEIVLITIPDQVSESDLNFSKIDLDEQVSAAENSTTAAEGNSYKAEINVEAGPPHMEPGATSDIKVTFTELGDSTPLGSARIYLDAGFDYTAYVDGGSGGLTVSSSYSAGGASRWGAVWETLGTDYTILLRADYNDEIDNGYLGTGEWVSVLFDVQAPASAGEYTFQTAAWTDRDQTIINNLHPDYRNPTIVVSDQISYRIIENILTDVEVYEVTGYDGNNQPILGPLPSPMPHPSTTILDLFIEYEFVLKAGHPYTAGAFYEFYLPDVFRVFNPVDGNLRDSSNQIYGTYSLDVDGKVTLLFNNRIVGSTTDMEGFVSFNTEIDASNLGNDLEQVIEIPIRDNVIKEIILVFEPNVATSIDKRGNPDRSYNTENITWEIDFNKDLRRIENPVIEDLIQANLTLDPSSVTLYELIVKLDGSVELGNPVDSSRYVIEAIDGTIGGADFRLRFIADGGETPTINSAYRLIFTTSIDDEDGRSYGNSATLTGSNVPNLTASATVAVGRGETLQKRSTGYVAADQVITWEIRANYNEKTLTELQSLITDTFGANQQFVAGSLVVYEIEIDANGNEALVTTITGGFTFTLTDDGGSPATQTGFTLSFDGGTDKAYRIVFQTEAVERVFTNTTVNNTVSFNGVNRTATRSIQQMILSKTHDQVNYADKTVRWTILVNRDSYVMTELVLTDIFTNEGLTYRDDTLAITGYSGAYSFVLTYDVSDPTVPTGFLLSFAEPVTGPLTIRFVTDFDYERRADEGLNYFENQATANWMGASNEPRTLSVTRRFTPDTYTQANGFKGGSYNAITKEITWTVGVNYNLQTVPGATVTDYILGDQTLITNSILVFEGVLAGGSNQFTRGNQLANPNIILLDSVGNELVNPDQTAYGFRVLLGNITGAYIIDYLTSIDGRLIVATYQNTAYLSDAFSVGHARLDASVSVQGGENYTDKSAIQAGRIIEWSMVINQGQSAISNVRVEDQLSAGQIFLRDSLALYATNVAANGNLTRGALLEEGTHYVLDVIVSDDHLVTGDTFILRFIGGIDRAYILEYQSFVLLGNGWTVSNNATLYAAEDNLPSNTGSSEAIQVRITAGQGGINGELGNLTILKQSANDGSLLPGAEFDLFHESGIFRVATGVTDQNGLLVFRNLVYGTYYIREVNAPQGYIVRFSQTEAIIDSPAREVVILNDLIIRDVRLLKTDAAASNSNRTIAGAVFELRNHDGNVVGQYETDQNGIIYVADLEPGDYRFVEITAAPYYQLGSTPVEFSIRFDQIAVLELHNSNTFISVGLTKTDDFDTTILLAGVPFRLEDGNGIIIYDRLETDRNGRIEVAGLVPGTYRFVELEAAPHYQLDQTPVVFAVLANQIQTLELTMTNSLIPGAINLLKVDRRTGEPLAGAVFRLTYEQNLIIAENLVTDLEGRINISSLRPGSYTLEELQAPAGYVLPRNRVTVVIVGLSDPDDNSGDLQELEISNLRRPNHSSGSNQANILQNWPLALLADNTAADPNNAAAAGIALPQTGGGISMFLLISLAYILAMIGYIIKLRTN